MSPSWTIWNPRLLTARLKSVFAAAVKEILMHSSSTVDFDIGFPYSGGRASIISRATVPWQASRISRRRLIASRRSMLGSPGNYVSYTVSLKDFCNISYGKNVAYESQSLAATCLTDVIPPQLVNHGDVILKKRKSKLPNQEKWHKLVVRKAENL